MNQYWWGNINKAEEKKKKPTSLVPLVWSTTQESLFILLLDILNCLKFHLRSGKWISYNWIHLMDISMFSSWAVYFTLYWSLFLQTGYCLFCGWYNRKRLSYLGNTSGTSQWLKNPFYWPGTWTSPHSLASFTTLSLCLPSSNFWFTQTH